MAAPGSNGRGRDRHGLGGRVGIDVGGTFIDLVLEDADGALYSAKILSDPHDLVGTIRDGLLRLLEEAGVRAADVTEVVHATTLGSNAVLERSGPVTALLTTRGFRDLLQIQRSLRYRMYDVQIEKRRPIVPRSLTWEISERRLADGSVLVPLDEDEVRAVAAELRAEGVETAAVSYLHAYADPAHERRTREILAEELPDLPVTISSDVSLQGREYERTNTAVVNAYLTPVLGRYLQELSVMLPHIGVKAPLWIMQSSGGLAPARRAAELPVRTVESGPAAGALVSAFHGLAAGHSEVISLDMGGTTAKAAVIREGRPATTRQFELERRELRPGSGLPLDIPAIDLVEIGGGGGSIARASYGVLQVGRASAGADPGPACYGRGGSEPTVTDANLLLGYLNADYFAGGAMTLDRGAAERAVATLAGELGLPVLRAAWGIHEVVSFEIERAIRLVSIDRGLDPRDFALVTIGGAAPAHGCRIARALGTRRVIVPLAAGVGSARGLMQGNETFELARTSLLRLDGADAPARVRAIFDSLEQEALAIIGESWDRSSLVVHRTAGLRYRGQGYELEVPLDRHGHDAGWLGDSFGEHYERTYGYREELPVEGVTWYLTLARTAATEPATVGSAAGGEDARKGSREAYFPETGTIAVPVYDRHRFVANDRLAGPALIEEQYTTTVVLPGDAVRVDGQRNLLIEIGTGD
ncbi:MAG: hydantoinase/oxoprolinase family protein [Gaiellaceae bacterium]